MFARSATVSDVAQNRSGELTHPMGRTRSIQRSGSVSEGSGGMTYAKVPTSSGRIWHRWNASDISHLLRKTGPSFGSASHMRWRSRGRHEPNCIAEGLVDVSVVSLTDFVDASGASEELHMRRGLRLAWSRHARREIFSRLPKNRNACFTDRMMLNPRCERS